jgi:cobalt-zinc-cadmium efflux system outer membrane protein
MKPFLWTSIAPIRNTPLAILLVAAIATPSVAQTALTWQQVKDRFEAANPSLRAGQLGIQESKAQEITANLRPNPDVSLLTDQLDPFTGGPCRPLTYALPFISFSYLHER